MCARGELLPFAKGEEKEEAMEGSSGGGGDEATPMEGGG